MTKYALALSGGGIRGLATLSFLKTLEEELGINVYDKFDLFAGTSIGSLITGSIVANKISATFCLENFFTSEKAKEIFNKSFWDRFLPIQFKPKYDGIGKTRVIRENTFDLKFSDLEKPLYSLAYCLDDRQPKIFGGLNDETKVYGALDSSSAAPTVFPPVKVDGKWYIDGGLVANNPSTIIVSKAIESWGKDSLSDLKILSVGTGYETDPIDGKNATTWGAARWLTTGRLVDIMLGGPSKYARSEWEIILDDKYLSINSPLTNANDAIDDTSDENIHALIALGKSWFYSNQDELREFLA